MKPQINRAFDTSYEAHVGLIHKLARKGYGRLMQANVCIDYEDVFQEMSLTYVKAAKLYDVARGITFSAYLGRAIWNQFNKFAELQISNYLKLSICSVEEMTNLDDEQRGDPFECIAGDFQTPEEISEIKQKIQMNNSLLGKTSRFIIKELMNPSDDMLGCIAAKRKDLPTGDSSNNAMARACNHVTFKEVVSFHNIDSDNARKARRQLNHLYGVGI